MTPWGSPSPIFYDSGMVGIKSPIILKYFFFLICTYIATRNMVGIEDWHLVTNQIGSSTGFVCFFLQFLFYGHLKACEDLVDITCCSWPFAYSRNGHDAAEELPAVQGV